MADNSQFNVDSKGALAEYIGVVLVYSKECGVIVGDATVRPGNEVEVVGRFLANDDVGSPVVVDHLRTGEIDRRLGLYRERGRRPKRWPRLRRAERKKAIDSVVQSWSGLRTEKSRL